MEPTKLITPAVKRVLPTHELNARRNRKRATLPHVPPAASQPQGIAKQVSGPAPKKA